VDAQENRFKNMRLEAYNHVLMRANPIAIEEAMKMQKVKTATIRDVIIRTGLADEFRQEGKLAGELAGKLAAAGAMFAEGDGIEKIARITQLPIDTLKNHLNGQLGR
jgi:uncharacterized protein YpbB